MAPEDATRPTRIRPRVNGKRRTATAPLDIAERNRLLQLLAGDPLLQHATRVELPVGFVVCEPGTTLDCVYFPQNAMLSVLKVMADGAEIEVASIGNEGSTATPILLGDAIWSARCIVQVGGWTTRIEIEALRDAIARSPRVRGVIDAYMQALFVQVTQSVACNGRHSVTRRCARWLLEAHDRAGADEFELPQVFLAVMLGVRRPSVTVAEQKLRDAGLIKYRRATVRIIDRPGLERAACECYRAVKEEFDRLLPPLRMAPDQAENE
jgi:CRP-like cAMP-binding protein